MVVASLWYGVVEETNQSVFVHDGYATRYHGEDDKARTMSMVIGRRRRDALPARDIGHAIHLGADGLDRLIDATKAHVSPQARAQAKELYTVGHQLR